MRAIADDIIKVKWVENNYIFGKDVTLKNVTLFKKYSAVEYFFKFIQQQFAKVTLRLIVIAIFTSILINGTISTYLNMLKACNQFSFFYFFDKQSCEDILTKVLNRFKVSIYQLEFYIY